MRRDKSCARCGESKPIEDFNFRDKARNTRQSYCRDCSNAAWRDWYSRPLNKARHAQVLASRRKIRIARHRELIKRLKNVPCTDCGHEFPPEVMDIDHLTDKEDVISRLVFSAGTERLIGEIEKCEVVCSNCHRIRTTARIQDSE